MHNMYNELNTTVGGDCMFKRQAITDERIVNAQNRIYRELYIIVMVICIISMIVKSILGRGGLEYVVAEFAILLTGGVYYLVRSARMGIYSEEAEIKSAGSKWNAETKSLIYSGGFVLLIGIVLGIVFGLNSALNYSDSPTQAVTYFVLVFFVTIFMYVPFLFLVIYIPHLLAKKKSERVNRQMLEQMEDDK